MKHRFSARRNGRDFGAQMAKAALAPHFLGSLHSNFIVGQSGFSALGKFGYNCLSVASKERKKTGKSLVQKRWILRIAIVAALSLPNLLSAQEQPEIALMASQKTKSGYLWTSSFQRADGSTCAWIRIDDGTMISVLYAVDGGFCRNAPPANVDVFEFTRMNGDMAQFGGPDFTILNNTTRMLSGNWNHVSRDTRFDLENVVFRFLPDPN